MIYEYCVFIFKNQKDLFLDDKFVFALLRETGSSKSSSSSYKIRVYDWDLTLVRTIRQAIEAEKPSTTASQDDSTDMFYAHLQAAVDAGGFGHIKKCGEQSYCYLNSSREIGRFYSNFCKSFLESFIELLYFKWFVFRYWYF